MVASIGYSLGIGSGIDTKKLIEDLAAAAKAPKEALIAKREAVNVAKISALGEASGAIDGFAAALSALVAGGTLFTQPTVSDESVLTASAVAGLDINNLSAQIEVRQLALAQTLVSENLATAASAVGQGDLTLTTATGSFTVTIDAANDSLSGLAKAINDKNAGVTATVVTDLNGSRLMLKGGTGEAKAFTLSVPGGTSTGLERFAYAPAVPGGMTAAQLAKDAIIGLDGVEIRRGSNSFSDVIPGVQIDLKRAVLGSTVSLGIKRPTTAITQAVDDFVAAYNGLHALLKEVTGTAADGTPGPLRGDQGMRDMQRQLGRLTSTILNSGEGPQTLAEIGVSTNRNGTLSVNATKLKEMLESDPQGVEALFNPRQYSSSPLVTIFSKMGAAKPGTYVLTDLVPDSGTGATGKVGGVAMISSGAHLIAPASSTAIGLVVDVKGAIASATITVDAGLGGALQAVRDAVRAQTGAISTAQQRLAKEAKAIAEDRAKMESRADTYYNQLVQSYTTMEKQVTAFKATQSYLDQQIKIWNGGSQ
jgi:flagellar hook-associated protein 2